VASDTGEGVGVGNGPGVTVGKTQGKILPAIYAESISSFVGLKRRFTIPDPFRRRRLLRLDDSVPVVFPFPVEELLAKFSHPFH
jgi:hypothetical protein